ncbi:hypothetical protein FD50_GL000095 [Liquorilactobacillus satsumensis DSM 16230 = JCM 12392]|uniref:Uncharacterized protein n=1 Tax=Liquorilactobacillus satsumensis DSM 16230 = JCM 12392 TaxID=1423801 RepID=A0A0R1V249_9LACO|nr:hypothetical protein FD50_GL000095 [Liquorilactobacillus satsumensis DSM 16230 = JCM 12392]
MYDAFVHYKEVIFLAKVLENLKLIIGDESEFCVYIGTTNEESEDAVATTVQGSGHLVIVSENNPENNTIQHADGAAFPQRPDMKISKISVKDSYRMDNVKYDDIKNDIVKEKTL